MRTYVVGFMFDSFNERVVVIRKNRPEWQKGKLNGVGGKIESGEKPIDAMIREFYEETTVRTIPEDWTYFAMISSNREADPTKELCEIFFFKGSSDLLVDSVNTATDEEIHVMYIDHIFGDNHVPNLKWLIPLALSPYKQFAVVTNG